MIFTYDDDVDDEILCDCGRPEDDCSSAEGTDFCMDRDDYLDNPDFYDAQGGPFSDYDDEDDEDEFFDDDFDDEDY